MRQLKRWTNCATGVWGAALPRDQRFAPNPQIRAFLQGVTAAAVGASTGATFVLGKRALVDVSTVLIAAVTLIILVSTKKVREPVLIIAAAAAGLLLHGGVR